MSARSMVRFWGCIQLTLLHPADRKTLRNLLVLVLHHPELVVSPAEEEDVKEELEDVENPEEDSSWVPELLVSSHAASSNCNR